MKTKQFRHWLLPVGVLLAVVAVHYAWAGLSPDGCNPAQEAAPESECRPEVCGCATASADQADAHTSWLQRYIAIQDHWLGLSYGMSLAFAVASFRRYRAERRCTTRNLAIGGVTLSGFLAVAGCYLLGCCGSPMLAVYLNLLGAAFLPLVKPLVAALTGVSILVAWWWISRRRHAAASALPGAVSSAATGCCCD